MLESDLQAAPTVYDYPLILRHLMHTPLLNAGNNEIVYADKSRYTYKDFDRRLRRLASGLESLGLGKGNTIAVMDWDSHRYLECFFAVPMMGAVLHTVNVRLSHEQILYTINHAEDDAIVVNAEFIPIIEAIKDKIERPVKLILVKESASEISTTLNIDAEYDELLDAGDETHRFEDFDENTRATTFYTTGTTGNPKGVHYTHRQIILHTLASNAALSSPASQGRFHREDVYMPITPMFHVHGWGVPFVATMMGVKQVYPGRYTPEMLLTLYEREDVSFSHCVPTILQMLLSHPKAKQVDLQGWKIIIGGSAMPQGLAQSAMDHGIDVFSGYGMSETCPILTLAQLDTSALVGNAKDQLSLRCSTGRTVPLVDLRIVNDDMTDTAHDGESTGEVVARAPWLTRSYVKAPDASAELWRGGYLHTGDIGHMTANGYLKVTDRLKDVIKSGGEWISSLEIEDLVSQLDGVSECAVVGLPDDKWGERPLVLVVKEASSTLAAEDVKSHLETFVERGVLSKWAVPERTEFVTAIEKTSVGKVDKKLLRQQYAT